MKLNVTNENYCAIVVQLNVFIDLSNCDNVKHAIILGNKVIVDKTASKDDIGIYFPVETQLSEMFLSQNNLFRYENKNVDITKHGYFEDNGRVKCVKFRNNDSEGFFIPIKSLDFLDVDLNKLNVLDEFNEIDSIGVCKKYIPTNIKTQGSGNKGKSSIEKISKICDKQFNKHIDTPQLYKNLHKLNKDSIISITYKEHGTSAISSKLLCDVKLNLFQKFLNWIQPIIKTKYESIYSSRTKIRNDDVDYIEKTLNDVWGITNKYLQQFIKNGQTIYYEIVGFTPNGKPIQKTGYGVYDYGCKSPLETDSYELGVNYKIKIYRITHTNNVGDVFEYSAKQVQDYCKLNGLSAVNELYYGDVRNLYNNLNRKHKTSFEAIRFNENWRNDFLSLLKLEYLEKDCYVCSNKVPEEGAVIRIDDLGLNVFKLKSTRFLEGETKFLDTGEVDIESNN